jgi:hypothetical protein
MLGRLRRLLREASARVYDEEDFRAARRPSDTAYPEINARFLRLIRKTGAHPAYLWGSLHGVHLAQALGIGAVSVIEFGVAGGNGLVQLEVIGQALQASLGVQVLVYGFDTGRGLPAPVDVRDCPNLFSGGDYPMDVEKLRSRLRRAELLVGDVADTVDPFLARPPPPVAFVSFDLDLYSSTAAGLRLFAGGYEALLPRVHCYFDDLTGFTYGDFNGERLAIKEFNEQHELRKISPVYALTHYVPRRCAGDLWLEKTYLAHVLDHPLYGKPDGLTRVARRDLFPTGSESGRARHVGGECRALDAVGKP